MSLPTEKRQRTGSSDEARPTSARPLAASLPTAAAAAAAAAAAVVGSRPATAATGSQWAPPRADGGAIDTGWLANEWETNPPSAPHTLQWFTQRLQTSIESRATTAEEALYLRWGVLAATHKCLCRVAGKVPAEIWKTLCADLEEAARSLCVAHADVLGPLH
jgi:hypothetical protein